ncbi:MAG: prolipoprotein diacylglyceryl transferase [Lachnospiraceae bacterium]|nr:prolipoprotein diacylglyceryl transferase [Lachnospiraceae bacterium]
MLPIINIGSFPIPVYGTLIAFSYIIGTILISFRANIYGYSKGNIYISSILAAIGMIVGAKLLHFITVIPVLIKNRDAVHSSLLYAIYYSFSGYVFYGGLLGAIIMIYLYCVQMDFKFLHFMNVITPAIPFIHSIGRIGCFMGGCCYGIEYHGFLSIHFPINEYVTELSNVPRFPIQLLEAAELFLLFIIFYIHSKYKYDDGFLFGTYLISYGILRFFNEFLRGDVERGFLLHMSTSQWISIMAVLIGIIICRTKKHGYNSN